LKLKKLKCFIPFNYYRSHFGSRKPKLRGKIFDLHRSCTKMCATAMCLNGCPKPTWNGNPGFCSKSCRDNPICAQLGYPRPTPIQGPYDDIVAFYCPGYPSPVDKMCCASFLGNFYPGKPFTMVIQGITVPFNNAEAAYQSLKYNVDLGKFSMCRTGSDAFKYKQYLDSLGSGFRDPTFHGFGSSWNAMWYVLKAKFANRRLTDLLLQTGEAFLLEHCDRPGRDRRWSNNNDGEGTNWLGLLLMFLRNYLLGRPIMHGLENLGLDQYKGPSHSNHRWMKLVRHHSGVVRRALH
jgi:hypothetical protein